MTIQKFPPIYRAVAFSVGGKPYVLRPANNTVVGTQMLTHTPDLSQVLEATHDYASLPSQQDENPRSIYQPKPLND